MLGKVQLLIIMDVRVIICLSITILTTSPFAGISRMARYAVKNGQMIRIWTICLWIDEAVGLCDRLLEVAILPDQFSARITGSIRMSYWVLANLKKSSILSFELDILGKDRPFSGTSSRKAGGLIGIPVLSWRSQRRIGSESEIWGAGSWEDTVPCSRFSWYVLCSDADMYSGWDWELDGVHGWMFALTCTQASAGSRTGRWCLESGKVLGKKLWRPGHVVWLSREMQLFALLINTASPPFFLFHVDCYLGRTHELDVPLS